MSFIDRVVTSLRGARPEPAPMPKPAAGDSLPVAEPVVEPPNAPSREELLAFVKSSPFWYHRIYLGKGVYTMPAPAYHEGVWDVFKTTFPPDLRGASLLDVGCNAGYFAIQAKRRGARRVVGLECVDLFVQQADYCKRVWDLDIEYRLLDAHQVDQVQETFDLVIFAGILYHLKNPLQVLEAVGRVCQDAILVETEVIPEDPRNRVYVRQGPYGHTRITETHKGFMKLIEAAELNGDDSNWWVPDTECVMGMLRIAGFGHFSAPLYPTEGRLLLVASKQRDSLLDLRALDPGRTPS